MSKKLYLFFILFCNNFLFSQKADSSYIECKYLVTFLIDTANIKTQKKEFASLLIGRKSSIFKSNQKAFADSLGIKMIEKSMNNPVDGQVVINASALPSAKFKPEVFYSDGKVTIYDNISRDGYRYDLNNKIEWKLESGSKIIQGYQCKKAVCKYRKKIMIAWYTDEIPIQEGPYSFKGLPGLILEIYDDKNYFNFSLVGLKNTKKPIESLPNGIDTTYEKFYKKRKERMDDPLSSFFGTFGKLPPKGSEEAIIRNIRNINNFLD
ncbi:GLPGLI family protein [Chryseobacterium gambrini]|uniref:GLPGLI family protein n=1 Tax=Chryseobacterium gambrini TaxID=373672 RepID=UPI0022F15C7A|nr:GLPGLI family protein [Chryseobacterium gambrini]WBV51715.1 GLPGLI family protein [Chryseobacterium gambrini]